MTITRRILGRKRHRLQNSLLDFSYNNEAGRRRVLLKKKKKSCSFTHSSPFGWSLGIQRGGVRILSAFQFDFLINFEFSYLRCTMQLTEKLKRVRTFIEWNSPETEENKKLISRRVILTEQRTHIIKKIMYHLCITWGYTHSKSIMFRGVRRVLRCLSRALWT